MTNRSLAHPAHEKPEEEARIQRLEKILAEAEVRLRNELMDADEHELLNDRIVRLRRALLIAVLNEDS